MHSYLFVANETSAATSYAPGSVTVYAPGNTAPVLTITEGIEHPRYLALDPSGNVYVSNVSDSTGSNGLTTAKITVYAPGSSSVLRTITKGLASNHHSASVIGVDASGRLYAFSTACGGRTGNFVCENLMSAYASGATEPLRTYSLDPVQAWRWSLAFDRAQNVYVGDGVDLSQLPGFGGIDVFTPGLRSHIRNIKLPASQVTEPFGLGLDTKGTLYVISEARWGFYNRPRSEMIEYASGSGSMLRSFRAGFGLDHPMAFDASNNLYVAEGHSIVEYAAGHTRVLRTITKGVVNPGKLVIDRAGNLYVLNWTSRKSPHGSVVVYAPGASTPYLTFTQGVSFAADIAIEP